MAGKRELTLVGARTKRLQKRTGRDWSLAKARAFLSALADTCNVTEACRQSGVSSAAVYRRKQRDARFRASWAQAIATAYQRLELVLLERAFIGTEKLITRRDGSEERMREYSNQLGLQLLKMHRDAATEADSEMQPSDLQEIRERIIHKLRRLKQRQDGGEDEGEEGEQAAEQAADQAGEQA